jgi:salicylate hydroxylase
MAEPQILIAGAGIAGLTAALALAARGLRSIVLERAERLEEVGAGIQLSPNAARILVDLGLEDALSAVAVEPDRLTVRSGATGAILSVLPLGPAQRAARGASYWVVHRGDLQAVLAAAALASPLVTLRTGVAVEEGEASPGGVGLTVRSADGAERLSGAALVGADGVASAVRRRLLAGPEAVFAGRVAWRGRFDAADWTGDPALRRGTTVFLGPKAHVVVYPIRSGREINVVAIVEDGWTDERWSVPGDPAVLARIFAGWGGDARAVIAGPASWRRWALRAVPPGGAWARGPVALVGDAAHAMLPFAAQGGAMAIEDAAVLARMIATGPGPMEARLSAYAALRRPRVEAVVRTAARNGRLYHLAGPAAVARDLALRLAGPAAMAARMDWIWSWRDAG